MVRNTSAGMNSCSTNISLHTQDCFQKSLRLFSPPHYVNLFLASKCDHGQETGPERSKVVHCGGSPHSSKNSTGDQLNSGYKRHWQDATTSVFKDQTDLECHYNSRWEEPCHISLSGVVPLGTPCCTKGADLGQRRRGGCRVGAKAPDTLRYNHPALCSL